MKTHNEQRKRLSDDLASLRETIGKISKLQEGIQENDSAADPELVKKSDSISAKVKALAGVV